MHWDVGKVGGRVEQLVRRIDLFKLNVGATEVVNEFGEDTGVGFNCAPAHDDHVCKRGFGCQFCPEAWQNGLIESKTLT